MSNTIDQYREAKNSYLRLKNQAKKELLARFHEVAAELLQLQRELLEDFGEKVSIPAKPKKPRAGKAAKAAKQEAKPTPEVPPAPPSPKVLELQKQLDRQKKRLADAQAGGKPTKALEDKVYELEDEIRLLQSK
jgi:hypothetical protein